jgi:signal transduction histidine kinase
MNFRTTVHASTGLLQRGLATAFESSAEAVVMTDENGIVQFCNPAIEEITGYSRLEMIGKRLNILGVDPHAPPAASHVGRDGGEDSETILCTSFSRERISYGAPEWRRQMWQTLRNQRPWAGEFVSRKKDGTSYSVSVKLTPIPAAEEKSSGDGSAGLHGLVASYRDVTVERRLQAQLNQSRSWEATGRMAAGIGHDFSNVVSVVNSCSEWLLSRVEQHHPFRDRICQIRQAGQRAAELIHQLMTLSKAKSGTARVIDVNQQIRRASSTLQHLAGMEVKFNLDFDPQAGMIAGDSTQFLQVLFNLTANARDAMPNGGTLTIATGHRTLQDVQPCQGQPKPGAYVTVTVTDSGTGMGELTKSRAFDPFFTTKDFGKGTGLGLSFVADVVRNSGGHIEVDTEVGGGSTFRLYFPELAAEHVTANGAAVGIGSR